MNVDELARSASQHVHSAARSMPVVPIAVLRRRSMAFALGGISVAVTASTLAWVFFTGGPIALDPPDVASPTSTVAAVTDTSRAVEASALDSVILTDEDAFGVPPFSASEVPLDGFQDLVALEPGPSGNLLVLGAQRLDLVWWALTASGTTDFEAWEATTVATWDDMAARAAVSTSDGVVVAGMTADGGVLRMLDAEWETAWSLPLDIDASEPIELAVDQEGAIWLGRTGVLPVDAGFAPVQWFRAATLDGRAGDAQLRREMRPLEFGLSIGTEEHAVSRVKQDGSGTRWRLPSSLFVVSADPFLDGLLVAVSSDPAITFRNTVTALYLSPGQEPVGLTVEPGQNIPLESLTVAAAEQWMAIGAIGEGGAVLVIDLAQLWPTE